MMTALLWLMASCAAAGEEVTTWPEFRGGARSGVVEDKRLPDTWSTTRHVVWKIDVPGKAWSSPIVWNDKIFLTTVVREKPNEEAKKGLYFGGERTKPPEDVHRWLVYCIDWNTGKVLWEKEAHSGKPSRGAHIKNTYASETPVTDGQRVYAYFGNIGVFCYDLAGTLLWSKEFESFPTKLSWGTASSPVVYKDQLFIQDDNEKESFLVALDARTGKELWRVPRDEPTTWATPFIWTNELRTELVTCGRKKVRSYDLKGNLLWELAGMSNLVIPTPLTGFGLLFISSGYVMDLVNRPIYAIKSGAKGDITLKGAELKNEYIAWSAKFGGPYNPSPILYGDYLYVLYDRGFLSCYDARTGKEVYSKERLGGGAGFTSSPWAANGKIFCLNEDGDTFVVQAGPEFKILGKNSLDDMCMATPAMVHGNLLIRTQTKLYRIGAPPTT